MSRNGDCWDNACAESFFKTLKDEEVFHRKYQTREEARMSVFEFIEAFYNRRRKHSFLGYLGPDEFERCKTQIVYHIFASDFYEHDPVVTSALVLGY